MTDTHVIEKPTIGRIVHVWQKGGKKPLAAFVTDVDNADPYRICTVVFPPTPNGQPAIFGAATVSPFKLGGPDVWWSWPARSEAATEAQKLQAAQSEGSG